MIIQSPHSELTKFIKTLWNNNSLFSQKSECAIRFDIFRISDVSKIIVEITIHREKGTRM